MVSFRTFGYEKKTELFSPHSFKAGIEMLDGTPKILISKVAYNKMWHYVDICNEEISWLGTVEKLDNNYLIKDVFLLKQEVSGTTTIITEDGLSNFAEEILKLPDGVNIYNNIRFWGHSHVYMDTGPSGQDESQMDIFKQSDHPFFIRAILNKRGRIEFTIYFYSIGLKVVDPEWKVYDPIDSSIRAAVEKEFNNKVSTRKYNYATIYKSGVDNYNDYVSRIGKKIKRRRVFKRHESHKTGRNIRTN